MTERQRDRSTPAARGALQARRHRRHAAHILRHGEAGGVVGRDAARGQLFDNLIAFLRAGQLDHDVLALRGDGQALREHPLAVAHEARIDLAREHAILAARRLIDRQDRLGALASRGRDTAPSRRLRRRAPGFALAISRTRSAHTSGASLIACRQSGGLVVTPRKPIWPCASIVSRSKQPRQLLRPGGTCRGALASVSSSSSGRSAASCPTRFRCRGSWRRGFRGYDLS